MVGIAHATSEGCGESVRFARTRHSLRFSHTKNMKVVEGSVQIRGMYPYCTAADGGLKPEPKTLWEMPFSYGLVYFIYSGE